MIWLGLVGVGFAAFVVSGVVCGLLVRVGSRIGAIDGAGSAGHVKSAVRRVPNVGGVGIVVGFVSMVLVGFALLRFGIVRGWGWDMADGAATRSGVLAAMLGCCAVLHVMGVVDDRRPLGAGLKLAVMMGCAAVMAVFFETRLFEFADGYVGGMWLSVLLTVVWFAAVTNAMNFMDNMDGLAGGTAVVAGVIFCLTAALGGQWFVAGTLATLVGSVAGFLVWNLPGAKLFMGDGGSLVVGFVLAFLTVRTTYFDELALTGWQRLGLDAAGPQWFAVLLPVCVLAVPLYDLVSVSAMRISQGRSPWIGDEQHLSHRLRRRGLSVWQVLVVVWSATAVTGLAGMMLSRLDGWWGVIAGVQVMLVLGGLAMAEWGSRDRG